MTSSIPAVRLSRLRTLVDERGVASIRELGAELGVSDMTIRRDIALLERSGALHRTRGGVLSTLQAAADRPWDDRRTLEAEAKDRIGSAAAGLVNDGDSLFLSSGTTSLALARQLGHLRDVTVVTNSVQALVQLLEMPGITVISTGGRAIRSGGHLSGTLASQALRQLRAAKAFVGASGITRDGVTNASLERGAIDRQMVESAAEVYILADHTKFGHESLTLVAGLESITGVVTDEATPDEHLEWLRRAGVTVYVATQGVERPSITG